MNLDKTLQARAKEIILETHAPGVVLAIGLDGEVIAQQAAGYAAPDNSQSLTVDHQFRIGSITKLFTATLVLLLAHDGLLLLEDRLDDHFPGTPYGKATLRQLLSHTGGVPHELPAPRVEAWFPSRETAVKWLLADTRAPLPPGKFHYSNAGFIMLGEVVEHVGRQPWKQQLDDRLLKPLGLTRTGLEISGLAATGSSKLPAVGIVAEPAVEIEAAFAAAGLWSTARDLLVFAGALIGNQPDVIPTQVVEQMHTVHAVHDDTWNSAQGLGLRLDRTSGKEIAGHGGWLLGYRSALTFSRATRTSAAALLNTNNSALPFRYASELISLGPTRVEPPVTLDACPDELVPLLGSWWTERDEVVLEWQNGALRCTKGGDGILQRVSDDVYVSSAGRYPDEPLVVEREPNGEVKRLIWAQYPMSRTPGAWG